MFRRSIYDTIKLDDQNTLTSQSADTNESPSDPAPRTGYMGSFLDTALLYATVTSTSTSTFYHDCRKHCIVESIAHPSLH